MRRRLDARRAGAAALGLLFLRRYEPDQVHGFGHLTISATRCTPEQCQYRPLSEHHRFVVAGVHTPRQGGNLRKLRLRVLLVYRSAEPLDAVVAAIAQRRRAIQIGR